MNKSSNEAIEGEVLDNTMSSNEEKVKTFRKSKLSYKQRKFVNNYQEGNTMGNATKSAVKAGYSEDSAASYASQLLKNPKVLAVLEKSVTRAEDTIIDVMDNDPSGATRLAAAREVLDRTQGKAIARSESVRVVITPESMLTSD